MAVQKYFGVIPGQTADVDFFDALDGENFEGLKGISDKAKSGDIDGAVRQFGSFLHEFLDPHKYDDDDFVPGGVNFRPNETRDGAFERIMNHSLISCGVEHQFNTDEVEWELNPTPDNYLEFTWQLQRHHEFQVLAWQYRHTKDEKYALAYRELITSWIAQSAPCPLDLGGGETNFWRTIECGIRMGHTWPKSIFGFLPSKSISDRDWVNIFKCVYEHGLRLRKSYTCSNWLIMEMNGLMHIALLFPFFKLSPMWEQFAVDSMYEQLTSQVYPDGFQQELTTNYHQVVIINYEATFSAFFRVGKPVPQKLFGALEKMYDVYPKIVKPDLILPNLNDGADLNMRDCLSNAVVNYPERQDFLFLQSGRKKGTPPEVTTCMLPYTGYAIMRSGWDENAFWCFFEDAPVGFGHRHDDKLEVLLHAYGKYMLPEAGRHAYDGSDLFGYSLTSYGHNTVLVDGQSQILRDHYEYTAEDLTRLAGLKFRDEDDYTASEGYYDKLYDYLKFVDVVHHRRVLWLKKPAGTRPLVVVIDRMEPRDGKEHEYTALWHMSDGKYFSDKHRAGVDFPEGQGINIVHTLPETVIVRCRDNPTQGYLCNEIPGKSDPLPTALCSISGGNCRFVTVLEATPDAKYSVKEVVASADYDDTSIEIITESGKICLDEKDYFVFD